MVNSFSGGTGDKMIVLCDLALRVSHAARPASMRRTS